MRMPGMSGPQLLAAVRARHPGLPMVMMTAYGTVEDAVAAMKAGARDFLTKPFSPQELLHLVRGLLEDAEARGFAPLDEAASAAVAAPRASARSSAARRRMARVLAGRRGVAGEPRAGADRRARAAPARSCWRATSTRSGPRRQQPFVAVNCAALPRELLESELFGHERGAFTGAIGRKLGKFELANGGTILLDEISEMEPVLQAKLLRVLQEHEVDRVGGSRPVPIDVRVIATTNRDLRDDGRDAAASGATSTTACTWCRSRCRRCASAREDDRRC